MADDDHAVRRTIHCSGMDRSLDLDCDRDGSESNHHGLCRCLHRAALLAGYRVLLPVDHVLEQGTAPALDRTPPRIVMQLESNLKIFPRSLAPEPDEAVTLFRSTTRHFLKTVLVFLVTEGVM